MILNLLIEDPGTETGWLALEDPEAGLRLGASTLAQTSSQVKRVSASNPYVPGTYTVRSVADNANEAVEIQVLDPESASRRAKVDYLIGLFTRASFRMRIIVDQPGTAVELIGQAADWSLNNQAEFMHYGMTVATFSFQVLPRWSVVTHALAVPLPEGSTWNIAPLSPQMAEHDHPHDHSEYLKDAPVDDVTYGRKNGQWVPSGSGGGGGDYLLLAGGTVTGDLAVNGSTTLNGSVASYGTLSHFGPAPSADEHLITKAYLESYTPAPVYGEHLVTLVGGTWRYRGAVVSQRPATATYADGGRVVWDTSQDATFTDPPPLAVNGDVWLPHSSVALP